MPPSVAGQGPAHTSNTVRPAEKGASKPDQTAVRMAVNGLTATTGMRRKAARAVVLAYASSGHVPVGIPLDGWAHWLRDVNGLSDPTGETARRLVDRERGGAHVAR